MWYLRNKTNNHRGKKRGETKKQTLNYIEQTDGYQMGGGDRGMGETSEGIKECICDKHRVLYGSVESLYCIPKTNITLYVN